MKKIIIFSTFLTAFTVFSITLNAQANKQKTQNADQSTPPPPATTDSSAISAAPADSTAAPAATPPPSSGDKDKGSGTRLRLYSGKHDGNNIISEPK